MILSAIALLLTAPGQGATVAVDPMGWGVTHAEFAKNYGKLNLYLPDDMRAGEPVSGSVFTEGAVQASDLRIAGTLAPISEHMVQFTIPSDAREAFSVDVLDSRGAITAQFLVPLPARVGERPAHFSWPQVTTSGMPSRFRGPFDGSRTTTALEAEASPVGVLTESLRSSVVVGPAWRVGRLSWEVLEGAHLAKASVNNVSVKVSPPDTEARVGRRADARLEVAGLEGLDPSLYPLTVEVMSTTPTIEFDNRAQAIRVDIAAAEAHGGTALKKVRFKAKKRGQYTLKAFVVFR